MPGFVSGMAGRKNGNDFNRIDINGQERKNGYQV
jgi:hypothetical protein